MATITPTPPASSPAPLASSSVYRMTVDEYERLAAARVLDDPRVELIDGLLVKKMTQKPPHAWAVEAAHEQLAHSCRRVGSYARRSRSGSPGSTSRSRTCP